MCDDDERGQVNGRLPCGFAVDRVRPSAAELADRAQALLALRAGPRVWLIRWGHGHCVWRLQTECGPFIAKTPPRHRTRSDVLMHAASIRCARRAGVPSPELVALQLTWTTRERPASVPMFVSSHLSERYGARPFLPTFAVTSGPLGQTSSTEVSPVPSAAVGRARRLVPRQEPLHREAAEHLAALRAGGSPPTERGATSTGRGRWTQFLLRRADRTPSRSRTEGCKVGRKGLAPYRGSIDGIGPASGYRGVRVVLTC